MLDDELDDELDELLEAELATLLDDDDTGAGEGEAPLLPPPQAEIDKVSATSRLRFKGMIFIKHPRA